MKNYNNVNRVEVIDSDGRQYVNNHVSELRSIFQDDGKTFKIFINNAMEKTKESSKKPVESKREPQTPEKEVRGYRDRDEVDGDTYKNDFGQDVDLKSPTDIYEKGYEKGMKDVTQDDQKQQQPSVYTLGNCVYIVGHSLQIVIDDKKFSNVSEMDACLKTVMSDLRASMLETLIQKYEKKEEDNGHTKAEGQ